MKLKQYIWCLLAMLTFSFTAVSCSDDDDDDNKKPEQPLIEDLAFKIEVKNIADQSADAVITPSNDTVTYFADIAPATMFEGMTDSMIIERVMNMVVDEDLIKGQQTVTPSKKLDPLTDYVVFAFGCNKGKTHKTIYKQNFRTIEPEKPQVRIEQSYEYGYFKYALYCTSKDACKGAFLELPTSQLDELIAKGISIDVLLDPETGVAMQFDRMHFEYDLNSDYGYRYEFMEYPGQSFSFIFCLENAKGGRLVQRNDYFLGIGKDGKAPEVEVLGKYNNTSNQVEFNVKCLSKDAFYVGQVVGDSEFINNSVTLDYEGDISEFLRHSGWVWKWQKEDILAVNSDEGMNVYIGEAQGLQYGMTVTLALDVMTADCGRKVITKDVVFGSPYGSMSEVNAEKDFVLNLPAVKSAQKLHNKWSIGIDTSKAVKRIKLPCNFL